MDTDTDEATARDGDGVTFAMQLARVVARAVDAALVAVAAVVVFSVVAYGILGQELPGSDDARGVELLYLGCCQPPLSSAGRTRSCPSR